MRNWIERFMYGRYGVDQLSRFLNVISLILLVISFFTKKDLVLWVAILLMIYSYFRILSRNTGKRYAENERFLMFVGRFTNSAQNRRYHSEQRKIYKYFFCPQCKQKVRVPKGKGKICITCPKCRMEFVRRS